MCACVCVSLIPACPLCLVLVNHVDLLLGAEVVSEVIRQQEPVIADLYTHTHAHSDIIASPVWASLDLCLVASNRL